MISLLRAVLHGGECEITTDDVRGIAVRVASDAAPGELLVSSTVKDLVAGTGLRFAGSPTAARTISPASCGNGTARGRGARRVTRASRLDAAPRAWGGMPLGGRFGWGDEGAASEMQMARSRYLTVPAR